MGQKTHTYIRANFEKVSGNAPDRIRTLGTKVNRGVGGGGVILKSQQNITARFPANRNHWNESGIWSELSLITGNEREWELPLLEA